MLRRFQNVLTANHATGKKILVALSGGQDSVVLLDLLLKSDCQVAIAHANFQLRGEDSNTDESWIRELALKSKISFHLRRFSTNNYASENGISVQMAARKLRYQWFDQLMQEEQYDCLATGHHLNDNLETSLINFVRGTGLSGLKGMPQRNGYVVRPLLEFTKSEIEEYARENQLEWREDSSNATDDYERNFIRHQVVPRLKEVNPSLEETFGRNAARWTGSAELVSWAVTSLKEMYMIPHAGQERILKSLLDLFTAPAAVLLELVKPYGFTFDQCREIVQSSKGQPGKFFLTASHRLIIDREHLIVVALTPEWSPVLIQAGQHRAALGPLTLEMKIAREKIGPGNSNKAFLANDKLSYPLLWRKWKPGDFFYPLGMDHRKKISDYLIDNKVSLADKEGVTVLESAGEIAWVVGHRIDHRFRISEDAKETLMVSLRLE